MSTSLRASRLRLILGTTGLALSLGVGLFLLPDASQRLNRQLSARRAAEASRNKKRQELADLRQLADRIHRGEKTLADLEARLPKGSTGALQWDVSQTLHKLADKNGLKLLSVKYSQPNREGSKDSGLESIEVEFVAVGLYANHKAFMLDLEGSGLPFAVRDGRLEESPEGARLDIVLRAYRRASTTGSEGDDA